jgi:hypothetical protein
VIYQISQYFVFRCWKKFNKWQIFYRFQAAFFNKNGGFMSDDECNRLNVSLLFLEMIIDISENTENGISELAWAAHSYVQSVSLKAAFPAGEA